MLSCLWSVFVWQCWMTDEPGMMVAVDQLLVFVAYSEGVKHGKHLPPLKFNSSPLKSYRAPIGKDRLATIIFQGRAVKLQGCTLTNIVRVFFLLYLRLLHYWKEEGHLSEIRLQYLHPGKLWWNPKSWRFCSDDFPFQWGVIFLGEAAVNFPGCIRNPKTNMLHPRPRYSTWSKVVNQ